MSGNEDLEKIIFRFLLDLLEELKNKGFRKELITGLDLFYLIFQPLNFK